MRDELKPAIAKHRGTITEALAREVHEELRKVRFAK